MPTSTDVQQHYDEALNFYNQQNYKEAEKEIKQAISADNINDSYYLLYYHILTAQNNWEEAEKEILKRNTLSDELSDFYNAWGNFLYNEEMDYTTAEEKFRKAIEHNPDSFIDYRNLGLALSGQEKTLDAIDAFKKSLGISQKLNPDNKYQDAYLSLSSELVKNGKWEEAELEIKGNLPNSDLSEFYNGWGNVLFNENKNYTAAEVKYRKAIEYNSDSFIDYRNLGLVLDKQDKISDAIEAFKKSIEISEKLNPGDKYEDAYLSLSSELGKNGKWEEGEAELQKGNLSNNKLSIFYNAWAIALDDKEDYINAEKKYRKAIEYNPDSFIDYRNLGLALDKQDKIPDAIEAFKKSIEISEKLNPGDKYEDAYISLSSELGKNGKWEEGEDELQRGNLSNNKLSIFYNAWAIALDDKEEYINAEKKYRKAIEYNPDSFIDYRNLGLVLDKQDKIPDAIEAFKKSIEISEKVNPDNKYEDAYLSLNLEIGKRGSWEEAEREIQKSNLSKDTLSSFYNSWGNKLFNNGESYIGAEAKYAKAIACNPDSFIYYRNLGLALSEQQKISEAIDAFKKAIEISEKIDPGKKYEDAYLSLSIELGKSGKWQDAEIEILKNNLSNNSLSEFYSNWGNTLYNQDKNYIAAEEKFRKATEYNADSVIDYNNLGLALLQQNKLDDAKEAFDKCIAINKDYGFAFENLGFVSHKQKKYDEALGYLDKALSITPNSSWALFRKASIYEERKQYEDAISYYEKILSYDNTDAFAQHNIANIYWNLGMYEQGRQKWEDTIKLYEKWDINKRPVESDENFYLYYGGIQSNIFGLTKKAELTYKKGLQSEPENIYILWALGNLYKQISEEDEENKPALLWQSRECFSKARSVLEKKLVAQPNTDAGLLNDVVQLFLDSNDFRSAVIFINDDKDKNSPLKKTFTDILTLIEEANPDSSAVKSLIGVYYSRMEDYKKAADYFSQSLNYDADNLNVWSNLAETYLNQDFFEKAYKEYNKILRKAPCHVESLIGLGECCIRFGEKGDNDFYELAVKYFNTAFDLSRTEGGSKILRNKEKSTLMYSRGLARVKIYENSKNIRLNNLLQIAFQDFNESYKIDKDKYKSKIAADKVTQRLKVFSSQRITEKIGPAFIFSLSLFVFIAIQILFLRSYFFKDGKGIDFTSYSLFTFGTLIFMIAALYLPNVLKLKVAGIELEKSSIDLISTTGSLGISRDAGSSSSISSGN